MIIPLGGSGLLHVNVILNITPVLAGFMLLKSRGAVGTVMRIIINLMQEKYNHKYTHHPQM